MQLLKINLPQLTDIFSESVLHVFVHANKLFC